MLKPTTIAIATLIIGMSAVTSIVAAQDRIPGAGEFSNGPQSHQGTGPSAQNPPARIPDAGEFSNGPRSHQGTGESNQPNTPPDRIPGADEFSSGPRSHNNPPLTAPGSSS
jgi:hypothetical protein